MFRRIRFMIYASPGIKTGCSILFAAGVGIFSNTLVTEMSTPTGIDWISFYNKVSFYGLSVFLILTYIYNRYLYVHEADVQNFRDAEYCVAYARSKLIPEQVEAYRKKIQEGHTQDMEVAFKELQRILKK